MRYRLDEPIWASKNIKYAPRDVLNNPAKYPDEYRRITTADLSHPILITKARHIIDGAHRLCRAELKKMTMVSVHIVEPRLLAKFKIGDYSHGFKAAWDKVDKLTVAELMTRYAKIIARN